MCVCVCVCVCVCLSQQQQQQQQVQQQQPKKEKEKEKDEVTSGEEKVKCIVCGRERKLSLMRSNKFCTQRCINQWSEKNPEGVDSAAKETDEPMEVEKQTPTQQKKVPRALKNLQIDMACEWFCIHTQFACACMCVCQHCADVCVCVHRGSDLQIR